MKRGGVEVDCFRGFTGMGGSFHDGSGVAVLGLIMGEGLLFVVVGALLVLGFWSWDERVRSWDWDGEVEVNSLFSYSGPRKGVEAERLGLVGGAVVGPDLSSLPVVNSNSGEMMGTLVSVGTGKRGVAGGRGNAVRAGVSMALS